MAGNVVQETDRTGRASEFSYDNLYRPTHQRWLAAAGGAVTYTANFGYNAASELISASDNVSFYALTYDNLGRRTRVDNTGTPNMPAVILDSAYNAVGNRTSLVATVNGVADFKNTYSFDNLSRMIRIEQTESVATGGSPVADKRVDLKYNALLIKSKL